MDKLTIPDWGRMIELALAEVSARADEFSRLDAVIGDGDHGEAIVAALRAALGVAVSGEGGADGNGDGMDGRDFKTLLGDMGFGVMMQTSGSTSTLLGGLLLGMSDGVPGGVTELEVEGVKAMFRSGLAGVQKNTKAQVGDKTMMDALVPGIQAMDGLEGGDICALLEAGAAAAAAGAERTVGMQANFGRARNYGQKSVGHMDSGAASWSVMLGAFARALAQG